MIIDTPLDWIIIIIGLFLMFSVWFPVLINAIGSKAKRIVPEPEQVNELLKRIGY